MSAGSRPAARGALGGDFWRLWGASTAGNLGDGLGRTALPLLAAALTRDPLLVAGFTAATYLPWLLFALPAGALVDRWDRRRCMALSGALRALVLGLLFGALVAGVEHLALLYATAFALGTLETFYDSAARALLPSLVGRAGIDRANSHLEGARIVASEFVAPPVASALFAALVAAPFGATAAAYAAGAALVVTMRPATRRPAGAGASPAGQPRGRRRLARDIRDGLAWLLRHRLLRDLALIATVLGFVVTGVQAVLVLYVLDELGVAERHYGLFVAFVAVGSVLGAASAARLARRIGVSRSLTLGLAVSAASAAGMAVTASPLVAAGLFACSAWAVLVWNILTMGLRQTLVPGTLLGRVHASYRFVLYGAMPLGAATGGVVGRLLGVRAPLAIYALTAAVMAVVVRVRVREETVAHAREAVSGDGG